MADKTRTETKHKTRRNYTVSARAHENLAAIAAEYARRTGRSSSHSAALEWAAAELRARIELERKAARDKSVAVLLGKAGPMVPPPSA